MKIKYLTFDCYGTLIDWRRGITENFLKFSKLSASPNVDIFERYAALESESEHSYSTYDQILASTFMKLAHQLNLDPSKKDAQGFARSITTWPAFEDTVSTLRSLGAKGYKRIILSNVDRDLLIGTISHSRLEVDGYITAEDVESYKPKEAHWTRFLDQYGIEKGEVIHIAGSVYHDIIPASRLGLKTIWVNRYSEPNEENISSNYEVESLSGILDILKA